MASLKVRYLETRRLKDGTITYVWNNRHARKAGLESEVLGPDKAAAITRAEELNALWDQVRTKSDAKPGPAKGTVAWMAAEIERSDEHREKPAKTQKEIEAAFEYLRGTPLGKFRMAELTGKDVRQFHRKVNDGKGVAFAQRIMKWLRFLLNEAVRDRQINASPMHRMRIERPPPRQEYWTQEEVEVWIAHCAAEGRPSIALAVRIAYDLGQRQGDVLRFQRSRYEEGEAIVQQGKTSAIVRIPALPELRAALDAAPKTSTYFVVSEETRRPYKQDNFKHLCTKLIRGAGFTGKTFQDLRRSAVVRLAMAGCTIPEIASITGHSLARVEQILQTYLPRTTGLARQAIERVLEQRRRMAEAR